MIDYSLHSILHSLQKFLTKEMEFAIAIYHTRVNSSTPYTMSSHVSAVNFILENLKRNQNQTFTIYLKPVFLGLHFLGFVFHEVLRLKCFDHTLQNTVVLVCAVFRDAFVMKFSRCVWCSECWQRGFTAENWERELGELQSLVVAE